MTVFSVVVLFLVAVNLSQTLAHALEFPGKMRLDEPTYRSVQAIYYPGFTFGGLIGEAGSLLTLPVLLVLTPVDSHQFWWIAAALGFAALVHATYWLFTHPVNNVWLQDTEVSGSAGSFFGRFSKPDADWRKMRATWEYSHVARAALAVLAFLSLTIGLVG